ncbi:hypothetical protein TELCIR_03092 [Teladorsagia circumcincta]|uniref:Uncharacterized protein n=1 Tax=Teladorsagia circumcincta TaxID=45464 RepID=A0A2G9UXJ7_TELCI|nr:hypothetical protein TELCIR_03092 [Teladorsagia circumcincta]
MTSLPNIPVEPKNGMIRTYNHDRTFTRPYSAKTVFFYKEGDEYFTVSRRLFVIFLFVKNDSVRRCAFHGSRNFTSELMGYFCYRLYDCEQWVASNEK